MFISKDYEVSLASSLEEVAQRCDEEIAKHPKLEKYFNSPVFKDAGKIYLFGGAVRDLALGRKPRDFDVITYATHEQYSSEASSAGFQRILQATDSKSSDDDYDDESDKAAPDKPKNHIREKYNVDGQELDIWNIRDMQDRPVRLSLNSVLEHQQDFWIIQSVVFDWDGIMYDIQEKKCICSKNYLDILKSGVVSLVNSSYFARTNTVAASCRHLLLGRSLTPELCKYVMDLILEDEFSFEKISDHPKVKFLNLMFGTSEDAVKKCVYEIFQNLSLADKFSTFTKILEKKNK
jgi:hypothetical protein